MSVFDRPTVQLFGDTPYNRIVIEPGIGSEQIVRAAIAQIQSNLEQATAQVQEVWDARDQDFAEQFDRPYRQTIIPQVTLKNYYTGQKPSLVEAPLDRWPSITVYCGNHSPAPAQPDEFGVTSIPLFIEVLCETGPIAEADLHDTEGIEAEDKVFRIAERLASAVHISVTSDPTLGGVLTGPIQGPPTVISAPPYARKASKGAGDNHIFTGRQLQYPALKNIY